MHFLNDELREKLAKKLGLTERRDLRQKLDPYGVQEYALASIASAIAVDARKQMESDPEHQAMYQQDMLIALFLLFPEEGDPPKLSETTGVPLLTINGNYSDARQLYFSERYSDNGKLLASLYKRRPELLVADPESMGLDGASTRTIAFLKWLGVASWPREIRIDTPKGKYLEYVLDNVSYPMKNEKHLRTKKSDFHRPFLKNVKTLDGLDDILKSEPAGVITWLALDRRAYSWNRISDGNGELWDYPHNTRTYFRFSVLVPSYIHWKIQSTPWLPAVNGNVMEPRKCMLGERGLEKLLPPPTDLKHELFDIYSINNRLKRNALENSGVSPDISHLDAEQIYEILTQLPSLDPTGKYAKTFYRNLLERIDTDVMRWPEVPESFIRSATIWGRGPQGEKYYPVQQILHADSEDFPELLCQHLTLVDLPKRVGPNKVRRLFGIEPVDRKKINQTIERAVELPETKDIQAQFQRTKPYLFYLRSVRSKQTSDIRALEDLQIVLCSTVDVNIEYEQVRLSTTLEKHLQWIIEGTRAYILYAESIRPSLESDLLANTIGAIVANLFDLTQGGEFARLIRCPENDRKELLKLILGESDIPGFDEIRIDFDQAMRGFTMELPENPEQQKLPVSTPGSEQTEQPNSPKGTVITDPGTGQLNSTKTSHTPEPGSQKREVVIRTFGGKQPGGHHKSLTKVIDPNVCENRAIQFEHLETRIPLKVSMVTGYNGPRCDILSFASMEDRDAFLKPPFAAQRDLSKVARFIEVKGRSHENSPISLKGNELDAARTFGDRYYLYRLYLESQNKYVLLVLQNPLNHPEVVEDVKDIYVSRASLDRYDLVIENTEIDPKEES